MTAVHHYRSATTSIIVSKQKLAKPSEKIFDDEPYYHIDRVDFIFSVAAAYFFSPTANYENALYATHIDAVKRA